MATMYFATLQIFDRTLKKKNTTILSVISQTCFYTHTILLLSDIVS